MNEPSRRAWAWTWNLYGVGTRSRDEHRRRKGEPVPPDDEDSLETSRQERLQILIELSVSVPQYLSATDLQATFLPAVQEPFVVVVKIRPALPRCLSLVHLNLRPRD